MSETRACEMCGHWLSRMEIARRRRKRERIERALDRLIGKTEAELSRFREVVHFMPDGMSEAGAGILLRAACPDEYARQFPKTRQISIGQ